MIAERAVKPPLALSMDRCFQMCPAQPCSCCWDMTDVLLARKLPCNRRSRSSRAAAGTGAAEQQQSRSSSRAEAAAEQKQQQQLSGTKLPEVMSGSFPQQSLLLALQTACQDPKHPQCDKVLFFLPHPNLHFWVPSPATSVHSHLL